jgi:hypothetical protein
MQADVGYDIRAKRNRIQSMNDTKSMMMMMMMMLLLD